MSKKSIVLTIDQGTTSTRALIYSFTEKKTLSLAQKEFKQYFPQSGWVEHDLNEIWETVLATCKQAVSQAGISFSDVAAIGITNQRETVGAWTRSSGKPLFHALVWQDRRTADFCAELKKQGLEEIIRSRTGLTLDPYFSASKIFWLLNNVTEIKQAALKNDLVIGTMDTFLIWKLTKGRSLVTDITNASRTGLFNIHSAAWDYDLMKIYQVSDDFLAEVKPCNAWFGDTNPEWFDISIPIMGVAGDQQASLFGHGCFEKGMLKSTYGTGAFLLVNTGTDSYLSQNHLLTTIAYQLEEKNGLTKDQTKIYYALEGSIFVAGSGLKWLKEKVGIIDSYPETEKYANSLSDNHGVYLVPAFNGLGTPYWNPYARGAILGMSFNTGKAQIARATLESLAYQTNDLIESLKQDGIFPKEINVDGGVVVNNWLLNFMVNILEISVRRPVNTEVTVMGASYLAALGIGLIGSLEEIKLYQQEDKVFHFLKNSDNNIKIDRSHLLGEWKKAIAAVEFFSNKNRN